MRRYLTIILLFSSVPIMKSEGLTFGTNNKAVIEVNPESSSGLDAIYVLHDAAGKQASFVSKGKNAVWYMFGSSGGAYADPVEAQSSGEVSSVILGNDDCGYIVEEGTTRHYYWIVNYANHELDLQGISVMDESDCYSALLKVDGCASPIYYYTINGLPRVLSRDIEVAYQTLEYDEETQNYAPKDILRQLEYIDGSFRIEQPLCDTRFTISGDRFLDAWHETMEISTGYYNAVAVEAHTSAEQASRENDNESSGAEVALGGSAPVDITFTAAVTDAVRFTEWQFSPDLDFEKFDLRFNQQELTYTFREYGTTYVRFQASNSDGSCDYFSEVYEVQVGESRLLCPNAFSPGNQDGVNDEWKVSYRSIVDFECHIFNRWGVKVAELTDPSQGWDGKYKGKLVKSGVYYYVIKAMGADGKEYDLSGDINIINTSLNNTSSGNSGLE